MMTKSTLEISTAIEVLIELNNKIDNGYFHDLPIEQKMGALYSADILIVSLTSEHSLDMFSDEEAQLLVDLKKSIINELTSIMGKNEFEGGY
jgi:hypothetical protein